MHCLLCAQVAAYRSPPPPPPPLRLLRGRDYGEKGVLNALTRSISVIHCRLCQCCHDRPASSEITFAATSPDGCSGLSEMLLGVLSVSACYGHPRFNPPPPPTHRCRVHISGLRVSQPHHLPDTMPLVGSQGSSETNRAVRITSRHSPQSPFNN